MILIGIYFLFSSILALWAFSMISPALSFQGSLGPFGAMLVGSLLLDILAFFTGVVCIVGGALFASKKVEEVKAVKAPKSAEDLYKKLLDAYSRMYGEHGKPKLDKKIGEYVNQGLTQEAAIQKVAEKEGYAE